eukprot:TRINITY_DN1910_c0_g1_i1.p1 TRINITY_DN1910_c0_g1~~TRINITY_DN1910_c0_g1_i1.p1  ORF type:complete len:624 (-),score=241.98 TRINITY_DN1910_c0_g1_i1:65-1936(-)
MEVLHIESHVTGVISGAPEPREERDPLLERRVGEEMNSTKTLGSEENLLSPSMLEDKILAQPVNDEKKVEELETEKLDDILNALENLTLTTNHVVTPVPNNSNPTNTATTEPKAEGGIHPPPTNLEGVAIKPLAARWQEKPDINEETQKKLDEEHALRMSQHPTEKPSQNPTHNNNNNSTTTNTTESTSPTTSNEKLTSNDSTTTTVQPPGLSRKRSKSLLNATRPSSPLPPTPAVAPSLSFSEPHSSTTNPPLPPKTSHEDAESDPKPKPTIHRQTQERASIRLAGLSLSSESDAGFDPDKKLVKVTSIKDIDPDAPADVIQAAMENYHNNKNSQIARALQSRTEAAAAGPAHHQLTVSEPGRARSRTAPEKPKKALPNLPEHEKGSEVHGHVKKEEEEKHRDEEIQKIKKRVNKQRQTQHKEEHREATMPVGGLFHSQPNKGGAKSLTDNEDDGHGAGGGNKVMRGSKVNRSVIVGGNKTDTEDVGTSRGHHSTIRRRQEIKEAEEEKKGGSIFGRMGRMMSRVKGASKKREDEIMKEGMRGRHRKRSASIDSPEMDVRKVLREQERKLKEREKELEKEREKERKEAGEEEHVPVDMKARPKGPSGRRLPTRVHRDRSESL